MHKMTSRDRVYVEERLASPATGVVDAAVRLRLLGYQAEADALSAALKVFYAECREVRRKLYPG